MNTLVHALATMTACAVAAAAVPTITWHTPSQDSLDSMPLSGRMGAGANVWVQDGSIWLYLAHNGAYDSRGRLLKLGCVRITPKDANLGAAGFSQTLDPDTGTISIVQGEGFKSRLWFAGETLVFESENAAPVPLEVAFGTWREKTKEGIRNDMMGNKATFYADQVQASPGGFLAFHRNADHPVDVAAMAQAQGIAPDTVPDVTARRVSGSAIAVEGGMTGQPVESEVRWQFWNGKAWTGTTEPRQKHVVTMRLAAAVDADPTKWPAEAKAMFSPEKREAAKRDEEQRWSEFWNRSHIHINAGKGEPDPGFLIGRNYQLFRYMQAANREGEFPQLFNGGIFTTDNNGRIKGNNNDELPTFEGEPITPDFRRWSTCVFMAQNQRWLGWPTLANGDKDLLSPTTLFYRDRSKVAASRARTLGSEGTVFVEMLDVWGMIPGGLPNGLVNADHLKYHFSMGLENAWMNLQAHDTLGTDISKDLPWIEGLVVFYDSYYRARTKERNGKELDDHGKLHLYPSNAVEYASGATNPVEVVAGLHRVTERLVKLPQLDAASRDRITRIRSVLPDLPIGERAGRKAVLAAVSLEREYNKWEPIEMFAAWPYRMVGITRPDTLQLARDTWDTIPEDRARLCKQDYSWMPNVANMAALAAPDKARERAIYKMANTAAPQARFPAFFGPGHDWLPDFNWGGSGMVGIQEMLLAPEPGPAGKLHLFGAWPAEWDVDFKLQAPGPTIVEASLQDGKLASLKVTPASREKDIVNWLGKHPAWEPLKPRHSLGQGKPITASSQFIEPGYDAKLANDGDPKTRWASDFDARSGWLEIEIGEEKRIGSVLVSEIEWKGTRRFSIEVKQGDTWKEVASGTTIGTDKEIAFTPVKASRIRLNIAESEMAININEFQVFPVEAP